MSQTLYEKYGGFGSVNRVVMEFYDRLLDSENVGDFFEDVDMRKLIDHQTKFVAYLLGGPADYTGERLLQMHAHLKISNAHFDEVAEILDSTLADSGFTEEDRVTIIGAIESRRAQIVSSP